MDKALNQPSPEDEQENLLPEKMTSDELIARINELAAKNRTAGLTDSEIKERTSLRAEYVRRFRESLTSSLDSIFYIGDDGREHKLKRKNDM